MPETIWDVADYYEVLEVARSATPEAIRAAITAQRRIWVRRQSSPDLERRAEAAPEPAWPPPEKPGPRVIWDRPDAEDYHLDMGDKYQVPRRPPPVKHTPEVRYQPFSTPYPFD